MGKFSRWPAASDLLMIISAVLSNSNRAIKLAESITSYRSSDLRATKYPSSSKQCASVDLLQNRGMERFAGRAVRERGRVCAHLIIRSAMEREIRCDFWGQNDNTSCYGTAAFKCLNFHNRQTAKKFRKIHLYLKMGERSLKSNMLLKFAPENKYWPLLLLKNMCL